MWGRAIDRFHNVQVFSAGGLRTVDMDVWVDFRGYFGKIDFKMDSNPHFSSTDPDIQQKLLLSYIIFNQDMTGYTSQQLKTYYQQNVGQVANDAILQTIDRIASNEITKAIRPIVSQNTGIDINVKQNILSSGSAGVSNMGVSQVVESQGNSTVGNTVPIAQVEISKPLDQKLTVKSVVGVGRNLSTDVAQLQGSLGLQYELRKNLTLNVMTGSNELGQQDTNLSLNYSASLPDIMSPKPGDTTLPKFVRVDVYPVGLGKIQVNWETDKVTRCEVKVIDAEKQVVHVEAEKGQQTYDHQTVIENLDPEANYQLKITAEDLNRNQGVTVYQVTGLSK
jgi:hypothetical protein